MQADKDRTARRVLYAGGAIVALIVMIAIGYAVGSRVVPVNSNFAVPDNAGTPLGIDDNAAIPSYTGPPPASSNLTEAPPPPPSSTPDQTMPDTAPAPLDGSVGRDEDSGDTANPSPSPATAPDGANGTD